MLAGAVYRTLVLYQSCSLRLDSTLLEAMTLRKGIVANRITNPKRNRNRLSKVPSCCFASRASGKQLFPGWPLVWVFGIIAAAVLIYYSFVYMRACKLKAEIVKEKRRLELGYGRVK